MLIDSFCSPAIVYLVFSVVHVLMALFDEDVKGAFLQAIMGLLITLLYAVLVYERIIYIVVDNCVSSTHILYIHGNFAL